jgi:hypothetical protein
MPEAKTMSDQQTTKPDYPGQEVPSQWEIDLRADYEREDERWSTAGQVRDALIIFCIGVFVFLWMFVVFLVEPGIR